MIIHPIYRSIFYLSLVPDCDHMALFGNGFCNDEANTADCNYDGGDCCVNVNTDYCFYCTCYLDKVCAAGYHLADGYCNDETNNLECNYDGGDCCGHNINTKYCTECKCLHQETCLAGVNHALVGNGFCNDETNIPECNYDGGDCCGPCIDLEYCSECACFGGMLTDGITNPLIGNGICNDAMNNETCSYDGGDCCVNINTANCSECNCLGGGTIMSPGFPDGYDKNLHLTWLIQFPHGQAIQINFVHLDISPSSVCQ